MHIIHKMRPIATDVARSVVCVSVCVLGKKRLNRPRCRLEADLLMLNGV